MVQFRPFQPADADAGIALWRMGGSVRPWNDPHKDSARKLRVNPEWFLIAEGEERIGGSVMVGNKGHRGWINDLAVEPALQRSGLGRALMHEAERILRAPGCPKNSPQVRRSHVAATAFYARLGFAEDDVISLGKRVEHD